MDDQPLPPIDPMLGSPDRFGYSWEKFNALTSEQEQQFRRWISALGEGEVLCGKTFLDAGCGAGRNSFWAMKQGAVGGVALDVDARALEAARRNLRDHPEVEVRLESIYHIADVERFDVAFSIGVIHHLEHPEVALRAMSAATRPGGEVVIWVYGYENMAWYVHLLNPGRRWLFSRLPVAWVRWIAYLPAAGLWLFLRAGWGRLAYFQQIRFFPFRHLHHIVFDQMLPRIAHYYRQDEVESLMRRAGLDAVRLRWVNEISWSAVGVKPDRGG